MPAKSKQQMKYIYAMRNKYGSKKNAPKDMKWVFDQEWTSGVKMKKLPEKAGDKNANWRKKSESHIMDFSSFCNESEVFDDEYDTCGCDICNCVGECRCECCCSDREDEVAEVGCENCSDPMCNGLCKYKDDFPGHTKYAN